MRKLHVFNQLTLDGYFTADNGDLGWAHKNDAEWTEFVEGNASGEGPLLFGRITYEMMASFWPTPFAVENMPVVASHMNSRPKVVFTTTMKEPGWNNVKMMKDNLIAHVNRMKTEAGADITILGSGSIVAQLAAQNLIDEYHLAINPVALGKGKSLFHGMTGLLNLMLSGSRVFRNGNVLLSYKAIQ
jgi:dihydrofolate reductase